MAKSKTCKYCGAELDKQINRCPNCNKKVKHPIRTAFLIFALLIILLFILIVIIILSDSSSTSSASVADHATQHMSTSQQDTSSAQESKEQLPEKKTSIVCDDKNITAEFLGFEDFPDLGMFTVNLRVANKTDKKIWVYLNEASVNDEMMQMVMSGVPLYILPDKRGSNAFIFYYTQISIDKFEEVDSVSFKIVVEDEDTLTEIETTPEITITSND